MGCHELRDIQMQTLSPAPGLEVLCVNVQFLESNFAEKTPSTPADSRLNLIPQCTPAAKAANCALGCIGKSEARVAILPLSLPFVRHRVEHHTQSWALLYKKGMDVPGPSPVEGHHSG